MSPSLLNLYKKAGETPLECINRFRNEHPDFATMKLSYAGRLDPLAEGVLLVLVGEENKQREKYLAYPKEYIFDALFGIKTDTYDVLGKILETPEIEYQWPAILEEIVISLTKLKGKILQPYPPFSSKPYKGKPLFEWAKEGKIDELDLPVHEVEMYETELLSCSIIGIPELSLRVFEMISRVKGDFRQEAILASWNNFFKTTTQPYFNIVRIKLSCSSGTYVRGIVNELGKKTGLGALALKIVRTKIGEHTIDGSL